MLIGNAIIRLVCIGILFVSGVCGISFYIFKEPDPPTLLPTAKIHFFARHVQRYGPGRGEPLDVEGIVFSPDGRTVGTWVQCPDPIGSYPPLIWDVAGRNIVKTPITGFRWFDYGNQSGVHQTRTGLIGVMGEEDFAIRDIKIGQIVRQFNRPNKYECTAWTFSPDGKTLWWADKQQRIFWQSIQ